jgi:hypothetical protein
VPAHLAPLHWSLVPLAHRLAGLRDIAVARGFLADRFATLGPPGFAQELEPLVARAAAGIDRERTAMVVVASWIAHACARGEEARLLALGAAAAQAGLPFARVLFGEGETRAIARGARLAEVPLPVFANISGLPWPRPAWLSVQEWQEWRAGLARSPGSRRWMMRPRTERARMHHDPVFIGRLLDQSWLFERDAVVIAARRPTIPAIVLAVATRDRWFRFASVREALGENPYAPPMLARALGATQAVSRSSP